jgi:hypothetical protein
VSLATLCRQPSSRDKGGGLVRVDLGIVFIKERHDALVQCRELNFVSWFPHLMPHCRCKYGKVSFDENEEAVESLTGTYLQCRRPQLFELAAVVVDERLKILTVEPQVLKLQVD